MPKRQVHDREVSPAQRGQIIQRILVDGWTSARAADAFEVEEWRVSGWVAAYRRDGMASLRADQPGDGFTSRLNGWLQAVLSFCKAPPPAHERSKGAPCVVLPQSREQGQRR
jgi:transposase